MSMSWSPIRSEEHTSELQSLRTISYAGFCLKKKKDGYAATGLESLRRRTHASRYGLSATFGGKRDLFLASLELYSLFFFNDTATTQIYTVRNTLSLHDALPI